MVPARLRRDVSVGSKTEVTALKFDFRCYPNNGHAATASAGPFRANSGSETVEIVPAFIREYRPCEARPKTFQ
jgi:hypothetical protein